MLKENTLFGVCDKVAYAIKQIKLHEPKEGYYVAFSGGKDSTVILDLVKKSGVKYDAHHNLTGIEPPELIYFIKEHYPSVITDNPKQTIWKMIIKHGMPPTRIVRYCCQELKEHGGEGRFKITGIRHEESIKRSKRKYIEPCMHNSGTRFLNPIIDWTTEDVWEYIHKNKLPYCKLYDNGWKRIGCMFCPMSTIKEKERQMIEYPKYKEQYIRIFQKMINNRLKQGKSVSWENGEKCFNWWIYGKNENIQENELFTKIDFL